MPNPFFTCILLSHDKPKYVWEAINSVRNQTFTDWECILFDSGVLYDLNFFKELEQDKRFNIVKSWETPQLRKRKTIASWCFNECFRENMVHGKYVTYLCDDDLLYPNAYQTFFDFLNNRIGIQACYATVDQTVTGEDGVRHSLGTIAANGIRGSCVQGTKMDLMLDYLQLCHSTDLLKEFPTDEYWPEAKEHVAHADGLFLEKVGLFTPIYPIHVTIGENRKVASSLNGGGEGLQAVLNYLKEDRVPGAKENPPCIVRLTPWEGVVLSDGRVTHALGSPVWDRAKNNIAHPSSLSTSEIYLDFAAKDDAHNKAARFCLDSWNKPPEFLFFLGRDIIPIWDCLQRLLFSARMHPDYDIYAGVYPNRNSSPPDPQIFTSFDGFGSFWDWTLGDTLTSDKNGICWTHMELTLIRVSVFQKLLDAGIVHGNGTNLEDEPWFLSEVKREKVGNLTKVKRTPDECYFCKKVLKLGGKILIATEVQAGNIDHNTGIIYTLPADCGPVKRAREKNTITPKHIVEPYNVCIHQVFWKPLPDGTEIEMLPMVSKINGKEMFVGYTEGNNIRGKPKEVKS